MRKIQSNFNIECPPSLKMAIDIYFRLADEMRSYRGLAGELTSYVNLHSRFPVLASGVSIDTAKERASEVVSALDLAEKAEQEAGDAVFAFMKADSEKAVSKKAVNEKVKVAQKRILRLGEKISNLTKCFNASVLFRR